MDPPEIADAARLAADAPPSGVLAPRDAGLGPAWLDLREQHFRVAVASTRRVVRALAPSLAIDDEARLFISSGQATSRVLARTTAQNLCNVGQEKSRISVVRGDDVLSRLEELAQAGQKIDERWREAATCWAIPPAAVLREATEEGAAATISHAADREAVEFACCEEPNHKEFDGRLVLRVAVGYRLAALSEASEDDLHREAERHADKVSEYRITKCGDHVALVAVSSQLETLQDYGQRIALVVPGMSTPLSDRVTVQYDEVAIRVDPSLLEFGLDTRPASEWLDG